MPRLRHLVASRSRLLDQICLKLGQIRDIGATPAKNGHLVLSALPNLSDQRVVTRVCLMHLVGRLRLTLWECKICSHVHFLSVWLLPRCSLAALRPLTLSSR